ncbi:MBOAT family protein [Mucilaginibacter corticis]|uniref:MBOAT family protein n=1 Tax=Mucilaginibacter corticis TaxID=2597670 RepID=A0A556MM67_9SPHI|nr:MBOAT family O-acyltransferase [Mucilaginibacter corticis]TSJ40993.1 MBOAT family protein [Mucilaginibacter corticis]
MLFNSFSFLVFFPLVTLLYYLLPYKSRWALLLLASCVFYCFFIPVYILILLVTIVIDYYAGIYIERSDGPVRKRYLLVSILSTCLVLFIFKYFNFFNSNINVVAAYFHLKYALPLLHVILPIGLSFHTFQSLSYVIEVYLGKQKAEKNFGIYSLYVMFYPQLVAGPIERPQNLLHQFYEKHPFNYEDVTTGLKKMAWGFFKKVVIADRLSIYVSAVYGNHDKHNGTSLLVATFFFGFQIYCDFSGYSDIAIGAARTMGFKLMTNFNRPFYSKNITEFWRRWHISLSTWFNDYMFTPITFAWREKGRYATVWALLIVFAVSGLWHGANWTYILWGLLNGMAIAFELLTKKIRNKLARTVPGWLYKPLSILLTFFYACFTWVFFRSPDLGTAMQILHKIVFVHGPCFVGDRKNMIYSVFFILVLLVIDTIKEYRLFNNFSLFDHSSLLVRRLSYVVIVIMILLFGVFDNNQFIYFQF